MPDGTSFSLSDLSAALADDMAGLVLRLTGEEPTQRGRDTWRWRAKGSLSVVVAGTKRGKWHDHEAGQGGDALALIAHLRREPLCDAILWARAWLGGGSTPPRAARPPEARATARGETPTMELARAIWRDAGPASGTVAETYLAARGLKLPPDAPIRFHPACPRGAERLPAMVALMTSATAGEPCGVHRTFLRPDGADRLRDAMGRAMAGNAGIIRLVPDEDVTTGVGLAEGIETALAVMQGYGWRPVWAATSAGMIRNFPILPGIEALTVFSDADAAGASASLACCERWVAAGLEVRICQPPAGDFNDLVKGRAA